MLLLLVPLGAELLVHVGNDLVHFGEAVLGWLSMLRLTIKLVCKIVVESILLVWLIVLLVGDHHEVIVASMDCLIVLLCSQGIFTFESFSHLPLHGFDRCSIWIQQRLVFEMMSLYLHMVFEANEALVDVEEMLSKTIFLQELADVFAFLHHREAWRGPDDVQAVSALLSVLAALEEVHGIMDELAVKEWALYYERHCALDEALQLLLSLLEDLHPVFDIHLVLEPLADLRVDGKVLLPEVLRWIQSLVGLVECQQEKLLSEGGLVAGGSEDELRDYLRLEELEVVERSQVQILLLEEFGRSLAALVEARAVSRFLSGARRCRRVEELALEDRRECLLDRDAEVVGVLALLVEIVGECLAPVALAEKRRRAVGHLIEDLKVDVGHHRREEVLLAVFEEEDVVENLGLPVHELADFVELRRVELQEDAAGQVMGLLKP